MQTMVSVLLTTYNAAEYLPFSIKSILNQTFKNFQFLIIDDGSHDNTKEVVKSFNDDRINYVKIQHVGRSKALNFGLRKCKYEWVALIDADDIAHPQRLEKQLLKNLEKNEIVITSSIYFENSKLQSKIKIRGVKFPRDLILHQPFPNSVLFNKNFILENGGYNENIDVAEDYELWLRLKNKVKFIVVEDTLMFIRRTNQSLSRKDILKTNDTIYEIQKKYYLDLEKHFGITEEKEKNFYRGWREFFFGEPAFARFFWLKNKTLFLNLRITIAYLITFLPNKLIEKFKRSQIRLRINFLLNSIIGKNKNVKKYFNTLLKNLKLNKF